MVAPCPYFFCSVSLALVRFVFITRRFVLLVLRPGRAGLSWPGLDWVGLGWAGLPNDSLSRIGSEEQYV